MEKLSTVSLWTKWKRPESIPYPNTWHRFTAKSKDGKVYKIKIVDLTPDRFEECLEFSVKYFYREESLIKVSKLMEDEVSFHNGLCKERAILQQRISTIAVLDEDVAKPKIVGLHKLLVISTDDETATNILVPENAIQNKLSKVMKDLQKNRNPFEIYNTDKLIRDFGLCVKSEYRGLNIGYHLVATVEKLAKAYGIKGFVIVCTSTQSQVIAERAGFKMINEIVYNEYKDDQGHVIFPIEGTKSLKLFGSKFV